MRNLFVLKTLTRIWKLILCGEGCKLTPWKTEVCTFSDNMCG